jgi:hypothetical protein
MTIKSIDAPSTNESTIYVSCTEDSRQQGGPMFDLVDALLQIQLDRNPLPRDFTMNNPEGYARRSRDLPANLPTSVDSGRC